MGSFEDDAYWNNKYAEASCRAHGEEFMHFDAGSDERYCTECEELEALERIYRYG